MDCHSVEEREREKKGKEHLHISEKGKKTMHQTSRPQPPVKF